MQIKGHWACDDISAMANEGIIKGITKDFFAPDKIITRGEFASIIARILGDKEYSGSVIYSDIGQDDWYYSDIYKITAYDLISGYEGNFRPNDSITREEMAKIVAKTFLILNCQSEIDENASVIDMDKVDGWAREHVQFCIERHLMNGMENGEFSPKSQTTRAQAAVVIKRLINK